MISNDPGKTRHSNNGTGDGLDGGHDGDLGALSQRVTNIPEAMTLTMAARARALAQQGIHVVNLTIGEPGFDTPQPIKDAAYEALMQGQTKYSPIIGIPELRQAASDKFARDNGLDYAPDEIVVSNGGKQAIVNACMTLLDPGDEAILIAPFWAAYTGSVKFAGGNPVVLETSIAEGFKITPEKLARAITPRTRMLFLNSPSNPTGAVYTRSELEALVQVVLAHPDVWILADEIYERIVFSGAHASVAAIEGARARTITVNGASKAFAMTGWRIGYSGAPRAIVPYLVKVQGMLTAGANPFAQQAAAFALNHMGNETETMRQAYMERRDAVIAGLAAIPGMKIAPPDGAFYAFPDVSAFYGRAFKGKHIGSSVDFADFLLDEARVSTVPGAGFGDDGCIRLSTAASMSELREGVRRIAEAVKKLC